MIIMQFVTIGVVLLAASLEVHSFFYKFVSY